MMKSTPGKRPQSLCFKWRGGALDTVDPTPSFIHWGTPIASPSLFNVIIDIFPVRVISFSLKLLFYCTQGYNVPSCFKKKLNFTPPVLLCDHFSSLLTFLKILMLPLMVLTFLINDQFSHRIFYHSPLSLPHYTLTTPLTPFFRCLPSNQSQSLIAAHGRQ